MSYGIVPRVGNTGLLDKAREFSAGAIGARSAMHPGSTTKTTPPGHTAGGALSAGMGGAFAGAGLASLTGATAATGTAAATTGALGLGLGAATGWGALAMGLAYFLS
jgi:hypothetical protein